MTDTMPMPRVTARGDDVAVTLDGVTLAAVEFSAPGQRPSPIKLREQLLAQYAEAVRLLGERLHQDAHTASATTPPASGVVDPVSFLERVEARVEEQAEVAYDPEGTARLWALAETTTGQAQERCVRVVVGLQGEVADVVFGPTAGQADDLAAQVLRGHRRACQDAREAVAETDPDLADRVYVVVESEQIR